jgi:hypothetical protein
VHQKTRPAGFGVAGVFDHEGEGIDRPVGGLDGADDLGIQPRFHRQGLAGREGQGVDPRGFAGPDEVRPVFRAVFRKGDEQAVRRFDAVGGDPPENPVFGNALPGRFGVVDRVTGAAVEETLVPAGGPGSEIPFFDEQRRDAAQGKVARDAGPGGSPSDD